MGVYFAKKIKLPRNIDSIEKVLTAIDVHYHLNHRINGKILFDFDTGTMYDGIGHYHYEMLDTGMDAKIILHHSSSVRF